jgi:hypothetical protein
MGNEMENEEKMNKNEKKLYNIIILKILKNA